MPHTVEFFWWWLQLCFKPHLDRRFAHKVMARQSCGSPNFVNFGTPTWESRDKMTFGSWLVTMQKKNYNGEGDGIPKFEPWWICVCLWFVRAPKVLKLHTNWLAPKPFGRFKLSLSMENNGKVGAQGTLPSSQHFRRVEGRVGTSGWD